MTLYQKDVLFPSEKTGGKNGEGLVKVEVESSCFVFVLKACLHIFINDKILFLTVSFNAFPFL